MLNEIACIQVAKIATVVIATPIILVSRRKDLAANGANCD
jgi:hypothetical protein